MNPEENLALFKDPAQWDLKITPRADAFVRAHQRGTKWTFALAGAGLVAAAAVVVATLAVAGALRPVHVPPAAPTPSPTAISLPEGSVVDDGGAMNATYGDLSSVAEEPEVELGSNSSVPWAVNTSGQPPLELSIAYVAGGSGTIDCGQHLGIDVMETETTVTITAVSTPVPGPKECAQEARLGAGIVTLESPLGERQLIHAPLTAPWDSAANILDIVPVLDDHSDVAEFAPVYSGTASCFNLLDDDTFEQLEAGGYQNSGTSFVEGIARNNDHNAPATFRFLQYGGLSCRWLNHLSPDPVVFSYGPISAAQANSARHDFAAKDAKLQPDVGDGIERWTTKDKSVTWVFGDGYWARVGSNNRDSRELMDELIANAPAF